MSQENDSNPRSGLLLVLSAPTGGGKTTIARRLVAKDPRLRYSVSHTTREPRSGEREGVDYHFVAQGAFEGMVSKGEFLEWAHVHDHLYGTHRSEWDAASTAGQDLVLDIDVQGGLQVKRGDPSAVLVFILPPSLDVLLERLKGRVEEPGFDLDRRLKSALDELELARNYDYNVLNEELDRAVSQVQCILVSARLRPEGLRTSISELRERIARYLRSQDVHRG